MHGLDLLHREAELHNVQNVGESDAGERSLLQVGPTLQSVNGGNDLTVKQKPRSRYNYLSREVRTMDMTKC